MCRRGRLHHIMFCGIYCAGLIGAIEFFLSLYLTGFLFMNYRMLGSTSWRVSAIAFGAWQLGDQKYWGEHTDSDSEATVRMALDSGINLFDTAEMYGAGESEVVLGKLLGARRDDVYVASKFWPDHASGAGIKAACEASLKRLGTDRIDLYQVHWPSRTVPFAESAEALIALLQEGKIRAVGVSNYGALDLADWLPHGAVVSNQVGYNLLFRAPEFEILPACRAHGIGVLVYMPLMQGLLSGRYASVEDIPVLRRRTRHFSSEREGTRHGEAGAESLTFQALTEIRRIAAEAGIPMAELALAWLLAQDGVTSAILGARRPAQLEGNLAAASRGLSKDVLAALDAATLPLRAHFGTNTDMWDGLGNSRIR